MSGLPLDEAIAEGMVPVVLTQTNFGIVSCARCAVAVVLGVALAFAHIEARALAGARVRAPCCSARSPGPAMRSAPWARWRCRTSSAIRCIVSRPEHGSGPWSRSRSLLTAARRHDDPQWDKIAYLATRRFSTLGIASVATLIVTGLLNAWILVGSFDALIITEYGRLLQVKLALFALMLGLAAVNRLHWTPRLAQASGPLRTRRCVS